MPRQEDVTPDELSSVSDMLRSEREFLDSTSRKTLRVKVDEGDSWLVRFLPVEMGPRKVFFARISQHWINRRPYFCAKQTPEDFGGIPKSSCPMCDLADDFNRSSNRDISSIGYKCGANAQWMMFCLVFEKGDEVIKGDPRWTPYQFWHNRTTFDDFIHDYEKSMRRTNLGILDLIEGSDIVVRNGKRGLVLKTEAPSTIFDRGLTEDQQQSIVDKIWSEIKIPTYRPLSAEEIDGACAKMEDLVANAGSGGRRRSRGDYDENDDSPRRRSDDDGRSRRGDDDAPSSRRRSDVTDDGDRRSRRSESEPERRSELKVEHRPLAPRVSSRSDRPESSRATNSTRDPEPASRSRSSQGQERVQSPTVRRAEPAPVQTEFSHGPEPSRPSIAARLATPKTDAPRVLAEGGTTDDDDNVTTERRDPAPIIQGAGPDPLPSDVEPVASSTPVPEVSEAPPATRPRLSDRLRRTIASTQ